MLALLVSLYEFGQFLRILLWISLPLGVVSMLITTWLHYHRKRKFEDGLILSMDGLDITAEPEVLIAALRRLPVTAMNEGEAPPPPAGEPVTAEEKENMYRGILWMKEKYEQYRDLADKRYEQLKEELQLSDKKYQDLLASLEVNKTSSVSTGPVGEATTRSLETEMQSLASATQDAEAERQGQELDARRRRIEELEGLLHAEQQKTEELMAKLQNSSQLLQRIYQELDKSLHSVAE